MADVLGWPWSMDAWDGMVCAVAAPGRGACVLPTLHLSVPVPQPPATPPTVRPPPLTIQRAPQASEESRSHYAYRDAGTLLTKRPPKQYLHLIKGPRSDSRP
ncbi:hypothetical protein CGMCC3_g12871 [Colletotrichum fructicola]|nr:uncharacterized protein CGMCC3_g12871 [Colletotrichum fructicola]KAE9570930.1 hypothetical protein CGMCC3_g12871 [Colletotrichum fructicola]